MDNTRKEIPLLIRPAASEDISDIAYLEEITFPIPWSLESIRHDVEENELATVIVAEWNGSFAGYMDVWQIAGEGQLNNIAVAPEYRGRGIGRKMIMKNSVWKFGNPTHRRFTFMRSWVLRSSDAGRSTISITEKTHC